MGIVSKKAGFFIKIREGNVPEFVFGRGHAKK
jgi:hypothetical protein